MHFSTVSSDLAEIPHADDSEAYLAKQESSWLHHKSHMLKQAREIRLAQSPAEKLAAFKVGVRTAAREYLVALDKDEFARCVRELNYRTAGATHVVKILISIALDDTMLVSSDAEPASGTHGTFAAIVALLRHLLAAGDITTAHALHALRQLVIHIDDLLIDVPRAREQLQLFAAHGNVRSVFPNPETSNVLEVLRMPADKLREARAKIDELIGEYFVHEDLMEAAMSLEEIGVEELKHEVVQRGILSAIDRSPRECELMSILIASFSGTELDREHVELAFELLLESVEEQDVPNLLSMLACFAARAISDEALAPAALDRVNLSTSHAGTEAVRQTFALLAAGDLNPSRLMKIWGNVANKPVSELKREVSEIIQEYYVSEEVVETLQCISELNCAYFHHEIVRRAFLLAIDASARQLELFSILMFKLHAANPSSSQLLSGFRRIAAQLDDIALDAPHARTAFAECVSRGEGQGWLPKGFAETLAQVPSTTSPAISPVARK